MSSIASLIKSKLLPRKYTVEIWVIDIMGVRYRLGKYTVKHNRKLIDRYGSVECIAFNIALKESDLDLWPFYRMSGTLYKFRSIKRCFYTNEVIKNA